jgi:DNA-binding response OmpR family regulator
MHKLKVLIAEDDKSIVALYRLALTPDVFEVSLANDGKEALDRYRSWKPDILVLDIMLPGITGYHVLREIRHEDRDISTTIILASALSGESVSKYSSEFGIQGYLAKPFNHKDIAIRIMQCYQNQKMQAELPRT